MLRYPGLKPPAFPRNKIGNKIVSEVSFGVESSFLRLVFHFFDLMCNLTKSFIAKRIIATFISEMRLHDTEGQRLYLTAGERKKFLAAAEYESPEIQMFYQILHYTGCRPSEVLELSASRIKIDEKIIVVRTLKKRKFDNQGR